MKTFEAYIDKEGNLQDFNTGLVDFKSFPTNVYKTLDSEYGDFQNNFDWNEKQQELGDGFNEWYDKNKSEQFLANIDNIISKTTQDMLLIKKKNIAQLKLDAFEELIIPVLDNDILSKRLTKFEEMILMDSNATPESIEQGFKRAKHLLGDDLETSLAKSELSDMFLGGDINIPAFERYIKDHPEKKKTYDTWKKLYDDNMDLFLKPLHAYRDTTPIGEIRELRSFLINYKDKV